MNPLIRPATIDDALFVAQNLQEADRQEVLGTGHDPILALPYSITVSESPVALISPEGKVAGVAGVSRTDAHSGGIWLLTTDVVKQHPKLFIQGAKEWVAQQTGYEMLHNIADPRNQSHLKLLKILGFKRLGYVSVGPNRLTYVEFAKLTPCAYPPP